MDSIEKIFEDFSASDNESLKPSKEDEIRVKQQVAAKIEEGKRKASEVITFEHQAQIWGVPIPQCKADLRNIGTLIPSAVDDIKCRISSHPFAKGSVRAAYHGQVQIQRNGPMLDVILKEFMLEHHRNEQEYTNQAENSAVAHYLVHEYCRRYRTKLAKPIRVVKSRVLKVNAGDDETILFNVEEKLQGTWKKWTNNGGSLIERNDDLFMLALWVHSYSNGYMLLADIQGIETETEIILTDPAILCTDHRRFGPTNFSPQLMQVCLHALKHASKNGWSVTVDIDAVGTDSVLTSSIRRPGFSLSSDEYLIDALHQSLDLNPADSNITTYVAKLIPLLRYASIRVRESAVRPLTNLTVDKENRRYIARKGGISALIPLLKDDSVKTKEIAAGALKNLATDSESHKLIAKEGGVTALIPLLRESNANVRESAARALTNLARDSDNQILIVRGGAVPILIRLLSDSNAAVRESVIGTLSNLACDVENQKLIAKEGGVLKLITLLADPHDVVRERAAGALSNLALDAGNRKLMKQHGGVPALMPLLIEANAEVRDMAARTLKSIATEKGSRKLIAKRNCLTALKFAEQHGSRYASEVLQLIQRKRTRLSSS